EKLQQHVEKRLAAYYRMGRIGFLNAVFSSSGLSSLIRFDEAFQLMLQRDRQAAKLYRTKIRENEQATDQLREQQEILTALVEEVRRQEQRYSQSKQEREALLNRVMTQKQLYGAALREMHAAAEELTVRLNELKQEALAEARQDESPQENSQQDRKPFFSGLSFAAQKGKLAPPVEGTVTKTFGKSTTKKFGLTLQTNGIIITAPPGSAIKAIYYGRVVYVGELKGYGNIIILDHDKQYYSLISRAEKYFKHKGDVVMPGEVIGVAGDESGLLENGLHFEIRKGTKPLDPLDWLRPGSLKIASGS
ncbi:MAG: peptidoglycan DD-metalloendopeptidase family protein, partial [Deltaproteobacteria bacterium]